MEKKIDDFILKMGQAKNADEVMTTAEFRNLLLSAFKEPHKQHIRLMENLVNGITKYGSDNTKDLQIYYDMTQVSSMQTAMLAGKLDEAFGICRDLLKQPFVGGLARAIAHSALAKSDKSLALAPKLYYASQAVEGYKSLLRTRQGNKEVNEELLERAEKLLAALQKDSHNEGEWVGTEEDYDPEEDDDMISTVAPGMSGGAYRDF